MFKRVLVLLLVGVVLCWASGGWAATYYIDAATGNDSDDGLSEANAWLTVSTISGRTFAAGDTIYIMNGTYSCTGGTETTPACRVNQNGTAANPITITAYPGHSPIIEGGGGTTGAVMGAGADYHTISDLEVQACGCFCLTNAGAPDTIVRAGIIYELNALHGVGGASTENCSVIFLRQSTGAIIRDNVISDNQRSAGGQNNAGIMMEENVSAVIHNNRFYSLRTGIFNKYGGDSHEFHSNYIHDVEFGIIHACFGEDAVAPCQNSNIHHNIIAFVGNEGFSGGATTTGTSHDGTLVEHNTFHSIGSSASAHGIRVDGATPGAIIRDTYVQCSANCRGNLIFGTTMQTSNYNAYNDSRVQWILNEDGTPTTYTTWAGWQAATWDANGLQITGTPFTGTPVIDGTDPTVYRPSSGGGLQNISSTGSHIGAYDDVTVARVATSSRSGVAARPGDSGRAAAASRPTPGSTRVIGPR